MGVGIMTNKLFEYLIQKMEEVDRRRGLSDNYLKEHGCNTREDIGIAETSYGIVTVPIDWVLSYLKELA